jgi:hypothetical protein
VSAGLKPNDVPVNEASLRDYFAAHAPAEIPEWFRHTSPNQTFPPMPDYLELDECHRKVALDWQRDPCFDLPEELSWYGKKVEAHRAGRSEWNDADHRARYAQWRYAYADTMLEARVLR